MFIIYNTLIFSGKILIDIDDGIWILTQRQRAIKTRPFDY